MKQVAIIDYGNGNANSIKNALRELGVAAIYTSKPADIESADYLILPGVGHYGTAMNNLRESGLIKSLNDAVMNDRKPVLGICLGMQLMTEYGEEGATSGLNWIKGSTRKMRPENRKQFKIPNIGWSTISKQSASVLLRGIETNEDPFYFCHAFAVDSIDEIAVTAKIQYDQPYVALFELNNIFGVQFHPEKSQESGLKLMENFISQNS
jgi:glutamine amidotransferase